MAEEHMDAVAQAIADASGGIAEVKDEVKLSISQLAVKQLQLQVKKAETEASLKRIDEELKKVSEYDLPNAMAEAGMRTFELLDGSKIAVKKVYAASVKVENRPEAFAWMRERGHDALIKTEVTVPLGKGAHDIAEQIIEELKERFPDYQVRLEESVHWQTLRAFVKEQVEAEELAVNGGETVEDPLPRELLGVYIIDKAEIVLPKKKG